MTAKIRPNDVNYGKMLASVRGIGQFFPDTIL